MLLGGLGHRGRRRSNLKPSRQLNNEFLESLN